MIRRKPRSRNVPAAVGALTAIASFAVLSRAPAVPADQQPAATRPTADRDPDNDFVVAPPDEIPGCEDELRAAGVRFEWASLPVRPGRNGVPSCGAAQAVVYRGGPEKIRYGSSPIVSCGMALALARFERVLNEEAIKALGAPVVRISHLGTYSCRKMARFPDWVSEHSYANAIDVESFALKDGRRVSVLRGFGEHPREPRRSEGRFLDALSHRLFDEDVFSVVITPAFDSLHRNHFHLDLARYRIDGTRTRSE